VLVIATVTLAAALLYPAVVRTEKNLLHAEKWITSGLPHGQTWERLSGGPFSADESAWKTYSSVPVSSYWAQNVKMEKGHRYLVGMWMRRENARVVIWCRAKQTNNKELDKRLYLFGGFNECLAEYIRPSVKELISGDPNSWKLMYRPLEITEDLVYGTAVSFGIYMSTGTLVFSHPFVIDITGMSSLPLVVEQSDGKPVSSISLVEAGVRDEVWSRKFEKPEVSFRVSFDGIADALRGFRFADGQVEGHLLQVKYADGTSESIWAPQENSFTNY